MKGTKLKLIFLKEDAITWLDAHSLDLVAVLIPLLVTFLTLEVYSHYAH